MGSGIGKKLRLAQAALCFALWAVNANSEPFPSTTDSSITPRTFEDNHQQEIGAVSVRIVTLNRKTNRIGSLCTGVIIDVRRIITSAHCVDTGDSEELQLITGKGRLTDATEALPVKLSEILSGQDHVYRARVYKRHEQQDLAIVEVDRNLDNWVRKIHLSSLATGQRLVMAGYGKRSNKIGRIRSNPVDIVHIDDDDIWVTAEESGSCVGDSGGGIFEVHNGQAALVGILNAGHARCNAADRYTNISRFSDWLLTSGRSNHTERAR